MVQAVNDPPLRQHHICGSGEHSEACCGEAQLLLCWNTCGCSSFICLKTEKVSFPVTIVTMVFMIGTGRPAATR